VPIKAPAGWSGEGTVLGTFKGMGEGVGEGMNEGVCEGSSFFYRCSKARLSGERV
jgi:hypothetical protein